MPRDIVATPPGHVTSAGEGLRRGRGGGVSVIGSRLANLLPSVVCSSSPSSSSSTPAVAPAAAAAAMPLSLVPILAVVDVAGSTIVPAVTPLLVRSQRDCQVGETIDLSTKGRRRRLDDSGQDGDDNGNVDGAVPLIKVPRCSKTSSDDDVDQTAPLNLSMPRDPTRDSSVPRDTSSYRVICEWDATESSATSDVVDAAGEASSDQQATNSQILLLSGKQYEIVPLGDGRWISRNEYELQRGLQKSSSSGVELAAGPCRSSAGVDGSSSSHAEHSGSVDQSPAPPAYSSSSSAAAEAAKDEADLAKAISPDEVSSTIVTDTETPDASKDEYEEGPLQIAEDVTSEQDDDVDDDSDDADNNDDAKTEKKRGQCAGNKGVKKLPPPLEHSHHDHKDAATNSRTTSTADDDDGKCIDLVSLPRPLASQPSQCSVSSND